MKLLKTIIKKDNIVGYPCKIIIETCKEDFVHRITTYHLVPEDEVMHHNGVVVKIFKGRYLFRYNASFRTETMGEIFQTILEHISHK